MAAVIYSGNICNGAQTGVFMTIGVTLINCSPYSGSKCHLTLSPSGCVPSIIKRNKEDEELKEKSH